MGTSYQKEILIQETTRTLILPVNFIGENKSILIPKQKTTTREKFIFPTPDSNSTQISCRHERVINIYNKYNKRKQKKLTKTVQDWFVQEARNQGWDVAIFIVCDGSSQKDCYLSINNSEEANVAIH